MFISIAVLDGAISSKEKSADEFDSFNYALKIEMLGHIVISKLPTTIL